MVLIPMLSWAGGKEGVSTKAYGVVAVFALTVVGRRNDVRWRAESADRLPGSCRPVTRRLADRLANRPYHTQTFFTESVQISRRLAISYMSSSSVRHLYLARARPHSKTGSLHELEAAWLANLQR